MHPKSYVPQRKNVRNDRFNLDKWNAIAIYAYILLFPLQFRKPQMKIDNLINSDEN